MNSRIDAHHHLWDLGIRPQEWITGPEMEPINRNFLLGEFETLAAQAGVEASVLVQTICVPEETGEFLAIAAGSALVQAVVGWVDLEAPEVHDRLAELKELPGGSYLRGIRHQIQAETDPDWLSRPAVRRGLAAVAAAGLRYELLVRADQLPAVAETVRELPDVGFILDHAGKPPIASGKLDAWYAEIGTVAAASNVVCKISGLITEARWDAWTVAELRPVTERLLEVFGPSRLMIGTDWPVSTLAADYPRIWAASEELISALAPAEQAALMAGTSADVYRIG